MMIRIHNVPAFKVAHSCIAKNETRTYLNWLLVDIRAGVVVGCDGNRCAVSPCIAASPDIEAADGLSGRFLIKPEKKMLKRWLYINIDTEARVIIGYNLRSEIAGKMLCSVSHEKTEGNFPDYERVLHPASKPTKPVEQFGVNASLICEPQIAGEAEGVHLKFYGQDNSVTVKFLGNEALDDVRFTVMPMRVK